MDCEDWRVEDPPVDDVWSGLFNDIHQASDGDVRQVAVLSLPPSREGSTTPFAKPGDDWVDLVPEIPPSAAPFTSPQLSALPPPTERKREGGAQKSDRVQRKPKGTNLPPENQLGKFCKKYFNPGETPEFRNAALRFALYTDKMNTLLHQARENNTIAEVPPLDTPEVWDLIKALRLAANTNPMDMAEIQKLSVAVYQTIILGLPRSFVRLPAERAFFFREYVIQVCDDGIAKRIRKTPTDQLACQPPPKYVFHRIDHDDVADLEVNRINRLTGVFGIPAWAAYVVMYMMAEAHPGKAREIWQKVNDMRCVEGLYKLRPLSEAVQSKKGCATSFNKIVEWVRARKIPVWRITTVPK
jgi:hypothetical protein